MILAYRRGTDEEREFWKRTIQKLKQEDGDLEHALELLTQHGTINDTIERARHYGAMAKDALAIFKDSDAKDSMLGIVDFCIERAY